MFQKAKIQLVLNHGFFAEVALKMKYVEDVSVGTVGINTTEIRYNPEFVKTLTPQERIAILAHEALHYLFLHHLRGKDKDQKDWNIACDYAINPILKDSGFQLPKNHLDLYEFHGKNAEAIYELIHKDKQEKPQNESESGNGEDKAGDQNESGNGKSGNDPQNSSGTGQNEPQDWGKVLEPTDDVNMAEAEAEAKQMALSAMQLAKQAGTLPGGMEQIINEIIEPKQNWKELLLKFMAEKAKNDYSWIRPNPRYIQQGVYLPSLESLEFGKAVFTIDTSGSVDEDLLAQIFAELKEVAAVFNISLTVIHSDSKVQKVEEVDEDTVMKPVGGGGTRFQPAFDYVNENLPDTKVMIYFTDGYCSDKVDYEPEYETLWIIYDNPTFTYHFGTVIHIER